MAGGGWTVGRAPAALPSGPGNGSSDAATNGVSTDDAHQVPLGSRPHDSQTRGLSRPPRLS